MKTFAFKKIDAFATSTSTGNPAGAISLSAQDNITAQEMLGIARALKGFVSEVGYLWPIDGDTYGLRYFSSPASWTCQGRGGPGQSINANGN